MAKPPPVTAKRIDQALKTEAYRIHPFSKQDLSRQRVKNLLHFWDIQQIGFHTYISPRSYLELKEATPKKPFNILGLDPMTFPRIPSSSTHWLAKDTHGNILAYRYCLRDPDGTLLSKLASSAKELPPSSKTPKAEATQGQFTVHHYAAWIPLYRTEPSMSAEYRNEMPHSRQFLQQNQKLFEKLSMDFRAIDPVMYAKYTRMQQHLPEDVRALGGAWLGVAINLGQDDLIGVNTHTDWNDKKYGFNCVLPFGDYTGAAIILWQLEVILELLPGDVLFFMGGIIAHNTEKVASGVRNSIDLFSHEKVFNWVKKEKMEKGKMENKKRKMDQLLE